MGCSWSSIHKTAWSIRGTCTAMLLRLSAGARATMARSSTVRRGAWRIPFSGTLLLFQLCHMLYCVGRMIIRGYGHCIAMLPGIWKVGPPIFSLYFRVFYHPIAYISTGCMFMIMAEEPEKLLSIFESMNPELRSKAFVFCGMEDDQAFGTYGMFSSSAPDIIL